MAIEQIRIIKETETKADDIRRKSAIEAKKMRTDAEKQAAELIEKAEHQADLDYREVVGRAEEDAQFAYDIIIHQAEKDCADILTRAAKSKDEAIAIIVERVVS